MSNMQVMAVRYIQRLPESKLGRAVDYLRYLYEQDHPLDDFDYVLAKRADDDTTTETISFDELLQELKASSNSSTDFWDNEIDDRVWGMEV